MHVDIANKASTVSQWSRGIWLNDNFIWNLFLFGFSAWFLWMTSYGRRPFYMEMIYTNFLHQGEPFWDVCVFLEGLFLAKSEERWHRCSMSNMITSVTTCPPWVSANPVMSVVTEIFQPSKHQSLECKSYDISSHRTNTTIQISILKEWHCF